MSLAQGFPNTFSATQQTQEVLKNTDNETKKIYTDINSLMAVGGHAHTGSGSDGSKIDFVYGITNKPATLEGHGITDTYTKLASDGRYAPSGYGLGTSAISTPNLNLIINSGFYYTDGATLNLPSGYSNGCVLHINRGGAQYTQQFNNVLSPAIFTRYYNGTVWSPWEQLANINNPVFSGGVDVINNGVTITPLIGAVNRGSRVLFKGSLNSTSGVFDCARIGFSGASVWGEGVNRLKFDVATGNDIWNEKMSITTTGVGIANTSPKATLHSTGSTIVGVATTAITDANISNGQCNVWLNESNNTLTFRIRRSDGTLITKTL